MGAMTHRTPARAAQKDDDRMSDFTLSRRASAFNAHCPVGTPVRYWPGALEGDGCWGHTRSEAWELPSGEPVVLVTGYAGGIALSHVLDHPGFADQAAVDDFLASNGGQP